MAGKVEQITRPVGTADDEESIISAQGSRLSYLPPAPLHILPEHSREIAP
jgi:hypothetical protein